MRQSRQERIAARQKRNEERDARIARRQARREAEVAQAKSEKARRKQERAERKAKRKKRLEERRKIAASMPDPISMPQNTDPLKIYTAASVDTNHVLRDLWRGTAAFLVGGGPSLNKVDYHRLGERGIAALGINNVAAYVPCSAMTFSDPPEKFHHAIYFDPKILTFAPRPKLGKRVRAKRDTGEFAFTPYHVHDCPSVFGFDRRSEFYPKSFFTDEWASWGVGKKCQQETGREKCIFTFFIGLRLLHYLGVRRVYMLGVDFNMSRGGTSIGNYAFKETGAAGGNNAHYRVAVKMCDELVPVFKKANFEVFQTNRESRLTCWDYVSFEQALEDCRAPVPTQDKIDLADWYRHKGVGHCPGKTPDDES